MQKSLPNLRWIVLTKLIKQEADWLLNQRVKIPTASSLVSKMFGSGLQADNAPSSNTKNVYVPPPPPSTHGEGYYPYRSPPFVGTWENPVGAGVKKKVQRQRTITRKKQPIQLSSHIRSHFVIKPLSNFELMDWVAKLGIKHFRGIYSRDGLRRKIHTYIHTLFEQLPV